MELDGWGGRDLRLRKCRKGKYRKRGESIEEAWDGNVGGVNFKVNFKSA
jgi:hypothetical protein